MADENQDGPSKIINDPVWGPIELDPLCMKIIDTPQFQRLRHIKQLGGCSFVYPGACHSRFEHSIGTAHLARMMGRELQKKHTNKTITDQEILCLEVAGLCHDLGHGPFSHLFDQQFKNKCKGKKWTHEGLSIKILDDIFKDIDGSDEGKKLIGETEKKLIKALIEPSIAGTKEKPFLYEIISNEENKIDVDKWDYFSRDCHMLGLHHNFQCQRSIKLARIVDNHISFPKSEYFNLFDMFYTRFTLHRRAYQHPVVKAVEMMIADAFVKADNDSLTFPPNAPRKKAVEPTQQPGDPVDQPLVEPKQQPGDPGDQPLVEPTQQPGDQPLVEPTQQPGDPGDQPLVDPWMETGQKCLSESVENRYAYQWVTDDVLQQIRRIELDTIKNAKERGDLKAAQDIIDRIYCRDLYKLIAEKRVKWVRNMESVKKSIAAKLKTYVTQSAIETASLNDDVDEILNTYPVPEAKSLTQDKRLQDYIAEKLKTSQVPEEYFEIEVAVFNYGSGRKNPMENVKFHKKKTQPDQYQPNTSHGSTDQLSTQYESVNREFMDEKKSDMIPTTFEQIYVRLYWKGLEKNKEHQNLKEVLKNTFLDISEFECNMGSMYKGELVNI